MMLIFGAGALGSRLNRDDETDWGSRRLISREECDITDARQVMEVFASHQHVTRVYNCAAFTSVDGCEGDPERALQVNAIGAGIVALQARICGAHLFHISTDYVYSGAAGPATDRETPYPVNTYGRTKLLGEQAVRAFCPSATIVRVGMLYGVEYPTKPPMLALTDTYEEKVRVGNVHTKARKRVYAWDDVTGTPTFVGDVATMLLWKAWFPMLGTFNLAPEEPPTSWYELLRPHFGDKVQRSKSQGMKAQRPRNGGLIASDNWEIPAGGFERFLAEARSVGL